MNTIITILKNIFRIGDCQACAEFSFKLYRRSYDKKLVCDECNLEIQTTLEL